MKCNSAAVLRSLVPPLTTGRLRRGRGDEKVDWKAGFGGASASPALLSLLVTSRLKFCFPPLAADTKHRFVLCFL